MATTAVSGEGHSANSGQRARYRDMSSNDPLHDALRVIGRQSSPDATGADPEHLHYAMSSRPETFVDVVVNERSDQTVIRACGPFAVGQAVENPAFELESTHHGEPTSERDTAALIQNMVWLVLGHGQRS